MSGTGPKSTFSLKYPDETIILNRDPTKFKFFTSNFKSEQVYLRPASEKKELEKLLVNATKITPTVLSYIRAKHPELVPEAESKTLLSVADIQKFQPKSSVAFGFQEQLKRQTETGGGYKLSPEEAAVMKAEYSRYKKEKSTEQTKKAEEAINVLLQEDVPKETQVINLLDEKQVNEYFQGTIKNIVPEQGPAVNAELDLAVNALKQVEVQKQVEEVKLDIQESRSDYPKMTKEGTKNVQEQTLIVNAPIANETPEAVKKRLEIEQADLEFELLLNEIDKKASQAKQLKLENKMKEYEDAKKELIDFGTKFKDMRTGSKLINEAAALTAAVADPQIVQDKNQLLVLGTRADEARSGSRLINEALVQEPPTTIIPSMPGTDTGLVAATGSINQEPPTPAPEPIGPGAETIPSSNLNKPVVSDQGTQVTTTPEVVTSHSPRYHINSIKLYFESETNPQWDTDLENQIFNSTYTSAERIEIMSSIIDKYGPDILVFDRKSDSINEMHELVQLMFCRMRNMQRGNRMPMANIPVSQLVSFYNKLGLDQSQEFAQVQEPPITEQTPTPTPIQQVSRSGIPIQSVGTASVKLMQNQAIDKVVDKYRNAPYTPFGKPRISESLVRQLEGHSFQNMLGPSSKQDPMRQYTPNRYSNLKVAKRPKTMSMSNDCE